VFLSLKKGEEGGRRFHEPRTLESKKKKKRGSIRPFAGRKGGRQRIRGIVKSKHPRFKTIAREGGKKGKSRHFLLSYQQERRRGVHKVGHAHVAGEKRKRDQGRQKSCLFASKKGKEERSLVPHIEGEWGRGRKRTLLRGGAIL